MGISRVGIFRNMEIFGGETTGFGMAKLGNNEWGHKIPTFEKKNFTLFCLFVLVFWISISSSLRFDFG